jgi:uncharacterized protein with HEPN domain
VSRRPFGEPRREPTDPALADTLAEGQHCIDLAATLVDRFSYDAFMADELIQNSASMLIIRLREVSNRLPQQFKDDHPEGPWRSIIGMGNIIAHEYAIRADPDTVWNTLAVELPALDVFRTV